ncbi:transcriptional regulator NrdR [Bianquea renquensis]|uniref:Transcriptional repressor NrdR n=1 Tax=Bianquea renquensis TaxID=2763661 RepID=A0A926HVW1_9FIRM|nr:transcriptional regulator NrdR [Bianquea renquensis]MBC8542072.1 transcriptional repressor NrdR [Bianquea renquensis]
MKCPYCGFEDTRVIDSRPSEDRCAIRRRRLCEMCQKRFTTYEKVETLPLIVIKKDNTREVFDREKLVDRVMRACHKRPVPVAAVEHLADEIENTALNSFDKEIRSQEIGEMVMEKLRELDEVAYVRYASVYRQFRDIDTFMQELEKLRTDTKKKE